MALALVLLISLHQQAAAVQMSDYCITPPYIGAQIVPNLLLMIDNSASMYDLAWTDTSNYYCANAANTSCTQGSTCGGTAYCLASVTTTTSTSTTPLLCPGPAYSDSICSAALSGDYCIDSGNNKGQCKNAKVTTTTVTQSPIQCDNQSNPDAYCGGLTSGDSCNNKCTVTHSCFDNTYQNSKICSLTNSTTCTTNANCPTGEQCVSRYAGYFDGTGTYSFDLATGKFTSAASLPGSCTYANTGASTAYSANTYVCVNSSGSGASEHVTGITASGNFLNWLTASKFDIEKQILTGGKYDVANQALIAESRGCQGRKYIKTLPASAGNMNLLTFAIRGGGYNWLDKITSQATEYGQTFIEVYNGTYNAADCAAAVNDWMNVDTTNLGTTQKDTGNCTGTSHQSPALITFNQIVHDCYWYFQGHSLSNLMPVKNACEDDWNIISAESITMPYLPDAVCSNNLSHNPSLIWSSGATGYSKGYLGLCYTNGVWDDTCVYNESVDYCNNLGSPAAVADPSSNTISAGTPMSVPGFVVEAGTYGMVSMATLTVQVGTASVPSGLVNKYQNLIRFGSMTFQNNGSATECGHNAICSKSGNDCVVDADCGSLGGKCISTIPCAKTCSNLDTRQCYLDSDCPDGGACQDLVKRDGGMIMPKGYVGAGNCSISLASCIVDWDCPVDQTCVQSVGSHSAGLIREIDDIKATSWTPFGEGFYNAMGYFARSDNYPVLPDTIWTIEPTSRGLNAGMGTADTSFVTLASPNTASSYTANENPSQKPCQKNNVLLITDGMSTADQNSDVEAFANTYASLATTVVNNVTYTNYSGYDTANSCPKYAGSRDLPVLTWAANHRNIKNMSLTDPNQKHCAGNIFEPCTDDTHCSSVIAGDVCTNIPTRSSENISTYIVYAAQGTSPLPGLCNPETFMTAAAKNGGTKLLKATNLNQLNSILTNAFDQVAARAASGTAASVLASGEGSGANLIQAVFYPHKRFDRSATEFDEISWVGRLTNLWYFVDPYSNNSSIIEDNGIPSGQSINSAPWSGDKIMTMVSDANTSGDYILRMFYDENAGITKANRWADTGNGVTGTQLTPDITFENLGYLWESGTMLWQRDLSANPRNIKTSLDGSNFTPFSAGNASSLASYLTTSTTTEASDIISWITGSDVSGYRSRTVMMTNIDNTPRVWKLGDVINSTPRIQSWQALNNYFGRYGDSTYGDSGLLSDPTSTAHFVNTVNYKKRGMVYAGGNDGMMHAFKLGTLELTSQAVPTTRNARLLNPDTGLPCGASDAAPCGQEMWAYIPKQVLPYLKYMADSAYCHVDAVDLTPFIFDASIGADKDASRTSDSWRTVLIGGMRFGGACRKQGTACTVVSGVTGTHCVNTPAIDPADGTKGLGYSTYFALDVTNPTPVLLWEFSDEGLGYATSGPALVRINGKTGIAPGVSDPKTNGNWFVVIGSGPTGPIDTDSHQFMGRSDQPLQLYILNLAKPQTETWQIDVNYWVKPTGLTNAFSGSIMGATIDVDNDYQDELVYVPYVKLDSATKTWSQGGVGRLITMKDTNPANWTWSTLIDNVGPVTAAATKILDTTAANLWVYFGSGRYYYVQNNASDDASGQRYIFGIKDPCMRAAGFDLACSDTISGDTRVFPGDLKNVTNVADAPSQSQADGPGFNGWYIQLDPAGQYTYDSSTYYMAERTITDPLATSGGVAFFTTYKPFTDLCELGGKSFIWAVQYNTGGAALNLKGVVLVQVSTGSIEQRSLASAFTEGGGRKSGAISGKPPEAQGLSVQSSPPPVKRYIHVKER